MSFFYVLLISYVYLVSEKSFTRDPPTIIFSSGYLFGDIKNELPFWKF